MNTSRIIDKTFAKKGTEYFPASHVFETAVRLAPIPFLTERSGDFCTCFAPVVIDGSLNQLKLTLGNGSFPDGNGQHENYITEKIRGRQQKMKKMGKNNFGRKNRVIDGLK